MIKKNLFVSSLIVVNKLWSNEIYRELSGWAKADLFYRAIPA